MMSIRLTLIFVALCGLGACGGGGGSSDPVPGASGGGSGGAPLPGSGGGSVSPSPPGSSSGGLGVELEGGVSGTGLNFGPVQGFSSVIVNGLAMDVSDADLFVEGSAANQADLKVGQTVSIIGDLTSTTAEDLRYRSDVKGPLTSIDITNPLTGAAQLTVLGQQVRVVAATLYDDAALDLLVVGDLLEISGQRNANGELVASYVAVVDSLSEYKVVGRPANITATQLRLDGLIVTYDNATLVNFGSMAVSEDQRIEVRGQSTDFVAPASLTVSEVERLPTLTINQDAELELEGFINAFTSSSDFQVAGQAVSANASTVFEFGSLDSLGLNVRLEIEGDVDGDGVLIAERISIRPTEAVRVEGPLSSIDLGNNSVTALGLTFTVRALTELEDESDAELEPLSLSDLSVGDYVELRGFLEGSTLVAVELDRENPDPDAKLQAPVLNADAAAGTLDLFGVVVTSDAAVTSFEDDDDNNLSQAQFFNLATVGVFVEAQWDDFVDTDQIVDSLSIEEEDN